MLRMDQVHVVRHKVLVEGRSQRAVAQELGLSRTTVGKYVGQAAPVRKAEAGPRPRPVWDKVADRAQALLAAAHRPMPLHSLIPSHLTGASVASVAPPPETGAWLWPLAQANKPATALARSAPFVFAFTCDLLGFWTKRRNRD